MIDRALAEDLARILEVKVDEVPTDTKDIGTFFRSYISKRIEEEGLPKVIDRLQGAVTEINELIISMIRSNGQRP